MRTLRCIVVDDEPLAVSLLESFIQRTPGLELTASSNDPVLALSAIQREVPDLVFMDIQMPDLNGIELSKMLPEDTRVIFTTAFKEYALDGFEVSALDYLLKPVRYQKFLEAVHKAQVWYEMKDAAQPAQNQPDSIYVKVDRSYRRILYSDILYVVGMKDYVMIHTAGDSAPVMTHVTMKSMEDMLPSSRFMRVHRSYIVALDRIDSVLPGQDIMIGRVLIHVSDAYRPAFDQYLRSRSMP